MEKGIINGLLNTHNINVIEQHIVYSFLQNKNLDFSNSPLINSFLKDFTVQAKIYLIISSLEITDLKLLENYLFLKLTEK